jgi:hypothetical protein
MFSSLECLCILATFLAVPGVRHVVVSAFVPPQPIHQSTYVRRQMFTGIVEEMGTIVSLEERADMTLWDGTKGKGTELVVQGDVVMEGAYLG